jgi:16S rRNA (cytidine1402-2'-O)-methyltransferase
MPLYIVSTPIGNLSDITERAISVLKSAEVIAAEDTRHSGVLLSRLGVHARLISYHDFNKERRVQEILPLLRAGKSIAVISDAGTPGIADPCYHLVKAAISEKVPVVPVPGPSAMLAALVASGLPTDRFTFENFLPPKEKKRREKLAALKNEERTIILYESPYRILKTLNDMLEVLGDIPIVVARELTKIHETFYRGRVSAVLTKLQKEGVRGEFVVMCNLRTHPAEDITEIPANPSGEESP